MKRKYLISFLLALLVTLTAFAFTACKGGGGDSDVSVTLSQTSLSLVAEGSSGTLTATVKNSDLAPTWEIDNTSVATIQSVGKICIVKPVAEGNATVTASVGDVKATCSVIVSPAKEVETVTIFYNGQAVTSSTELTVERGKTISLTAEGSLGSSINWSSANETIATVAGGVVQGELPGTTTIYAYITSSIRASVTVTVTAPEGVDYYNLQFAAEGATTDENGEAIVTDKFFYWSARSEWSMQQVDVAYAYYEDGKICFSYTSDWDPGFSYGFQLFYKNSAQTIGNYYKLTCTINVDVACTVSLNGNLVDLKAGDNNLTVYYQYTDPLGSGETYGISSFDLVMGYADGTATGSFVKDATVTVSNISWSDDVREQLSAPSFTYNESTGVISISDPNTVGVGGYRLYLYDSNDKVAATVAVENGKAVDFSKVANGTYSAYIVAVAENSHYLDSAASSSSVSITVANAGGPSYTLENTGAGGAVVSPGEWTYWTEYWVTFTGTYSNGAVTVDFSNNSGNWYDTQLFYKNPNAVTGTTYKVVLSINSPLAGKVTISGEVVDLTAGTREYTVVVTETDSDATVQIIFGTYEQGANNQDIHEATVVISIVSIEEVQATKLAAPSFSLASDNVISITDPNTAGVGSYALGFFNGDSLVGKITVENGKAIEPSSILSGTYTVKLQAISENALYADSDWSASYATVTVANEYIEMNFSGETDIADDGWYYWNDHPEWCGSNVVLNYAKYNASEILVSFTTTSGACAWGFQLFHKDSSLINGSYYTLTGYITSDVNCKIELNGKTYNLVAGEKTAIEVTFAYAGYGADSNSAFDLVVPVDVNGANGVVSAEFTITDLAWTAAQAPETPETPAGTSFAFGEESVATANPGNWYYWNDQWWCGSYVNVSNASLGGDGSVSVSYSGSNAVWYGLQLFYKDGSLTDGTSYTLSMTIESSNACSITICGNVVSLNAGTNNVSVTYTEGSGASISIQFGVEENNVCVESGTFTLSNISIS